MATRKVGGIVAELLLNDKDFRQKLNRASKHTESFSARMRKQFNLSAAAVAKAGVVAAGVLAAGVTVANQRLDKLAKTSDKLGIAVDRLQAIRHAAKLSGVSVDTLDMALQRMVRRVSEARKGSGEAVGALAELGLDPAELASKSPDKQLSVIADAMNKVANQGDRVRLAMKLFDSEGVALINMLRMGSEGFDEIRAELERYGIALTRVDTAKIEAASNEFTKLRAIHEGLWNQMAVQLAPAIAQITELINRNADAFGGMDQIAAKTFDRLVAGAGVVADSIWGWRLIINGVEGAVLTIGGTAVGVMADVVESIEGMINKAIDAINWLIKQANRIPKVSIGELAPADFTGAQEALSRFQNWSFNRGASALGDFEGLLQQGKASDRLKKLFDDIEAKWTESAEKHAEAMEGTSTAAFGLDDNLVTLSESAQAAAEELNKLSVSQIADLGGDTPTGRLARRIEELNRQAMEQEAQGRGEAAGRTRERAAELQERLDLRQKGYTAEEIRSGEAAAAEAAKQAGVAPETEEAQSGRQVDNTASGSAARWQQDITAMRAAMDKLVSQFAIALT